MCFDTFDNRDATDYALTLNYKHKNYQHTRRSRTFLCGTDQNDYSEFALEWMIDELVDDGDEVVCLRVVEKDSKLAAEANMETHKYRSEAQKLLDQVMAKNTQDEKSVHLIMELAVGKVQDIIQRMVGNIESILYAAKLTISQIQIYEPAVLIVGTRGRSLNGMQGLLPGSVSKYCLQQSPIPVIVVRPTNKRMKKKKKRQADPTRKDYNQILSQSEQAGGGNLLEKSVRDSFIGPLPTATDQEAAAVAQAIGIPKSALGRDYRLTKTNSAKTDATVSDMESDPSRSPSPSIEGETKQVVLKSPTLKPVKKDADDDVSPSAESAEGENSEDDKIKDLGGAKSPFLLPKKRPGRKKKTPRHQPGRAVGAVVDEVLPERVSHGDDDRGTQILDLLEELEE